jgi:hypothetical protein
VGGDACKSGRSCPLAVEADIGEPPPTDAKSPCAGGPDHRATIARTAFAPPRSSPGMVQRSSLAVTTRRSPDGTFLREGAGRQRRGRGLPPPARQRPRSTPEASVTGRRLGVVGPPCGSVRSPPRKAGRVAAGTTAELLISPASQRSPPGRGRSARLHGCIRLWAGLRASENLPLGRGRSGLRTPQATLIWIWPGLGTGIGGPQGGAVGSSERGSGS